MEYRIWTTHWNQAYQGVTVNLYDDLGNFITSVMTDAEGNYLFEMLAPGDYQVGVIMPP
ncbi:MAG: SdrD B-like domain-containing protein [Saprospiraceae bacterium]